MGFDANAAGARTRLAGMFQAHHAVVWRALRRRGLARLVKLASIRWAKEQGYARIITGNAESNRAMLGLNVSLGYEPVERETHYVRDDLS